MVSLVCQTEVDADDPAFAHPTKFVGPVYTEAEGRRIARLRGWQVRPDGTDWRRVVPSPEPLAMVELPTIRMLVGERCHRHLCRAAAGSRCAAGRTAASTASRRSSTRT